MSPVERRNNYEQKQIDGRKERNTSYEKQLERTNLSPGMRNMYKNQIVAGEKAIARGKAQIKRNNRGK